MQKIINLTPHKVVAKQGEKSFEYSPESIPARCHENKGGEQNINVPFYSDNSGWMPIRHYRYTEVSGLPDASPDTVYIVSQMVAAALPNRHDLIFPAEIIRDASGTIVGCAGFGHVCESIVEAWVFNNFDVTEWNPEGRDFFYFKVGSDFYKTEMPRNVAPGGLSRNGIAEVFPTPIEICSEEEYTKALDAFDYFWNCHGSTGIMTMHTVLKSALPK